MDSMPRANISSASGEKTATSSRSSSGSRAAAQSGLSRSASSAIVSQMVATPAFLLCKELLGGLDRALDLAWTVGGRDEERLELRRRDVDALGEQMPEEGAVPIEIACPGVLDVSHRCAPEEDGQHGADSLYGHVLVPEPGLERRAYLLQLPVDVGVPEASQNDQGGSGGQWVSRQRARLVNRPLGRELVHDLGAPAEGRERQPSSGDLSEHGQIGPDPVALLGSAARDAESRDHLVEDEQGAGCVAEIPQRFQEPRRRRDDAHVPGHRLDDDPGELFTLALDGA